MKIVNGKAKFGPNDYYEAREMFENGYPIFVDDIGAFGGGRGKVIGFDAEDANNYGEDFEDESEDPTLADQIVCIDKKIGQSDLNWGEWYSLYEDMWTPDFEYENWIERENLEKRDMTELPHEIAAMKASRENESFNRGVLKMNLNEAKRVLRKNGYKVISEAEQNPMETLFKDLQKNEGPDYTVEFDKRTNTIYVSHESGTTVIIRQGEDYYRVSEDYDWEDFETIEEVREYLNGVFDLTI